VLARLLAQQRDEFLDRTRTSRRGDDDHRNGREMAHRFEALVRIVGQLLVKRRYDAHDRGANQQRVTVRLGIGHDLRGDIARHARLVVHDDLLTEDFRQPLCQQPTGNVSRPTGWEANDQPDRPIRVDGLSMGNRRYSREHHTGSQHVPAPKDRHCLFPLSFPKSARDCSLRAMQGGRWADFGDA